MSGAWRKESLNIYVSDCWGKLKEMELLGNKKSNKVLGK